MSGQLVSFVTLLSDCHSVDFSFSFVFVFFCLFGLYFVFFASVEIFFLSSSLIIDWPVGGLDRRTSWDRQEWTASRENLSSVWRSIWVVTTDKSHNRQREVSDAGNISERTKCQCISAGFHLIHMYRRTKLIIGRRGLGFL